MEKCFIQSDVTGEFVSGVTLSRVPLGVSGQVFFVDSPGSALFMNCYEAQVFIAFVTDVICWEFGEDLVVVSADSYGFC